jgi:hypothetical protein
MSTGCNNPPTHLERFGSLESWLVVHSVVGGAENLEAEQSQCIALPADPSDPLLKVWKKYEENLVLSRPKGIGKWDFRDPTNA